MTEQSVSTALAMAVEDVQAMVRLMERGPVDDVLIKADLALAFCADLTLILDALERRTAALESLDAHLDFSAPWEWDSVIFDPSGINLAMQAAAEALQDPPA